MNPGLFWRTLILAILLAYETTLPVHGAVQNGWDWRPVGSLPRGSQTGAVYLDNMLTWTQKAWVNGSPRYIQYILTGDGSGAQSGRLKRVLYEAPPGWRIDSAQAAGEWLAFRESAPKEPYRLRLINLVSGESRLIGGRVGQFAFPPNLAVDEGHLLWNALTPDWRSCLRVYDILKKTITDARCGTRPGERLAVIYLRWPVVLLKSEFLDENGTRYRMVGPASLDTNQPGFLASPDCSGKNKGDGLALACLLETYSPGSGALTGIMAGAPQAQDPSHPAAQPVTGAVEKPSLQVCGGRGFWLENQQEVHTWVPGGKEEVIHQTRDTSARIEALTCASGWVTISIAGKDGGLEVFASKIP